MDKPVIKEAILVEGKYDHNTLSQIVEAHIIETGGFSVFHNKENMNLLRRIAESRGLIIMTDSDGAGFVIRNHIKGMIPGQYIKHAYIPDIYGCEKRKKQPGKEGKIGVEGMTREVILRSLHDAGATFDNQTETRNASVTKQDLISLGLSGCANSEKKRKMLKKKLGMPELMSTNTLLHTINLLYDRDEFLRILSSLEEEYD